MTADPAHPAGPEHPEHPAGPEHPEHPAGLEHPEHSAHPAGPELPVPSADPAHPADPVLLRRHLYARLASLGQRLGYLFLLVAIVAFGFGFARGFPSPAVTVSITGLIGACIVLPPAIVAGYAVKAAEREDRQSGRL